MGNLYLHTHISLVIEAEQLATRDLWRNPGESEPAFSTPYVTVRITY